MSLNDILTPDITINLFNKDWKVNFTLRNYAAIKRVCGINEQDLLDGIVEGDTKNIIYAVWGSTLVFAPFNPADPIAIQEQMDLEKLFNLTLMELKGINDKLIQAITGSLQKQDNSSKKPQAPAKKKMRK